MTIQQLVQKEMNHFIEILVGKKQLTIENVIDIAAHTGAYLIRTRHQQNNGVSNSEIEVVLQILVDFLKDGFGDQIINEDLLKLKNTTLELLKNPSFDQYIQNYFLLYSK
jgi:hypothetical protein